MSNDRSEQSSGSQLRNCQKLIEALRNTQTLAEVFDLCAMLRDALDFNYFFYSAQFPFSFVKPKTVTFSDYPEEWRRIYDSNGYAKFDPTIEHCRKQTTPLYWGPTLSGDGSENQKVRRFLDDASGFGLNNGISVPIHGYAGEWGMLSLVGSSSHGGAKDKMLRPSLYVTFVAGHIQAAVKRLTGGPEPPDALKRLTAREKECLLWAAEGKTTWETARILDITESTVVFHFQNAAKKLNVANRAQAVARVVTQQPIELTTIRLTEEQIENRADCILLTRPVVSGRPQSNGDNVQAGLPAELRSSRYAR